jgi:hypothetical protein
MRTVQANELILLGLNLNDKEWSRTFKIRLGSARSSSSVIWVRYEFFSKIG